MAISDKTRKLLWGLSGNRCAYCRCELVMEGNNLDDHCVIGDECHIIAKHLSGPRGNVSIPDNDLDSPHNLILLCKVHHKMIDDQPKTFTVEILKGIKEKHEKWVRETLNRSVSGLETIDSIAFQLSGKEIISIISQALAYDFDHDELESIKEVEFIGRFLQNAQDWMDIASEVDSSWRVKISFEISKDLKELESLGFSVFGALQKRRITVLGKTEVWPVAVLRVIRNSNPGIKSIGDLINKNDK